VLPGAVLLAVPIFMLRGRAAAPAPGPAPTETLAIKS
jgi:hypothetical protein